VFEISLPGMTRGLLSTTERKDGWAHFSGYSRDCLATPCAPFLGMRGTFSQSAAIILAMFVTCRWNEFAILLLSAPPAWLRFLQNQAMDVHETIHGLSVGHVYVSSLCSVLSAAWKEDLSGFFLLVMVSPAGWRARSFSPLHQ
jgi:hypothetical protein